MLRKLRRLFTQLWTMLYYGVICYVVDRPQRVKFVNSVLAFYAREKISSRFPTVELSELFPSNSDLSLNFRNFTYNPGNVSFGELTVLASIVKLQNPRILFEFGTADGNTTFQLALNTSTDAFIYTVDLPPMQRSTALRRDAGDDIFIGKREVGSKFKGKEGESKIRQILCDSALLDVEHFRGSVNFIFIDGAHSYEYLHNDTEKALYMLSERGIIVWHDYLVWNDVTDYLNELSTRLPLRHIKTTSLVVYKIES